MPMEAWMEGPMSDEAFELAFCGDALREGEMDVRLFAPAVLGLADIFQGMALAANAGAPIETALRVRSGQRSGSFIADLALNADLTGAAAFAAAAFQDVGSAKALIELVFGKIERGLLGLLVDL